MENNDNKNAFGHPVNQYHQEVIEYFRAKSKPKMPSMLDSMMQDAKRFENEMKDAFEAIKRECERSDFPLKS